MTSGAIGCVSKPATEITDRRREATSGLGTGLAAASHLQEIVPDTVLVGGSAAVIHAGHRLSLDADHTLVNLREHFDDVLADLESVSGWKTARIKRPVPILGSLDGIETGIRQLIRTQPLKTKTIQTVGGPISVPTKLETLRIKGSLILKRNATRDYIDFIALADRLGAKRIATAMTTFDLLYPQPNGQSALRQLIVQLSSPRPFDREETDVTTYKSIIPQYNSWTKLEKLGRRIADTLFDHILDTARKRKGSEA